jgi:hypothetical protein
MLERGVGLDRRNQRFVASGPLEALKMQLVSTHARYWLVIDGLTYLLPNRVVSLVLMLPKLVSRVAFCANLALIRMSQTLLQFQIARPVLEGIFLRLLEVRTANFVGQEHIPLDLQIFAPCVPQEQAALLLVHPRILSVQIVHQGLIPFRLGSLSARCVLPVLFLPHLVQGLICVRYVRTTLIRELGLRRAHLVVQAPFRQ